MKKHLTTILSFAMTMLMAFTASFTLTSCGEEVIPGPDPKGRTVFSAGPNIFNNEDGTRTTMDKYGVLYWQFNDQIWLNDGGTWVKSSESQLSPDNKSANFYYNKLFANDSYQIVYTGLNSTSATEVKIPAEITASSNYLEDIGRRGDCGVATACRGSGTGFYEFRLEHKASYLGIAPLKVSYLKKTYFWTKIEITDYNNKPIAGTFGFSWENGVDTTNVTSPSSKVTVTPSEGLTPRFQSYNSNYSYLYIVLPPCHRRLNVKYHFTCADNPAETMVVSRQLNPWKYFENNVVQFHHAITPDYYRWDAPKTEPFELPRVNNNTGADFVQATKSCATMPNANELYWYLVNGDPRWDNSEESKWTDDDGASYHTGGVWIKRKAVILAEGKTFDSNVGKGGVDMRTTFVEHAVNSDSYLRGGRPSDAEIGKYFFLPTLGWYTISSSVLDKGVYGRYWSSSAAITNIAGNPTAYHLVFNDNQIMVTSANRRQGCITGNGSDWFK